ncbi:hypothetical protein RB195_001754 [Necator americanus]|uniref:Uncharacterized protein n=1 Tax=Necator americanus TaxID=51031 RepID=A0ABR1DFZ8_NECAM
MSRFICTVETRDMVVPETELKEHSNSFPFGTRLENKNLSSVEFSVVSKALRLSLKTEQKHLTRLHQTISRSASFRRLFSSTRLATSIQSHQPDDVPPI